MRIDDSIGPRSLLPAVAQVFTLAARKVHDINRSWEANQGTPVCTVAGRYTSRGWTEWTQGFQYGCALLVFDGTADRKMLELGRTKTRRYMVPHLTHTGVHDHGFNNLSTYGNLWRLMREGRIKHNEDERAVYELALQVSGAVQAARWAGVPVPQPSPWAANSPALGYIYSFNGPHSLFVDTLRTTRILGVAWQLGQVLRHEGDRAANLLKRSVLHGLTTSQYVIFHGDSGHTYDVPGRTSHEAIFNRNDGGFRCRSTQQGYSPFSTWSRGLAWAMLGFAEELEFFDIIPNAEFKTSVGLSKQDVLRVYERNAIATCEHYLNDVSASDGIPYWDDGAPGLAQLNDWRSQPANPSNDFEPVDSSAAAIAAQGLMRLGHYLGRKGTRYTQAGLTIARTLFDRPYLSIDPRHQGLILHSIYHRPNGWDHIPPGRKIPCGESSLWGDYHALELAVLIQRLAGHGNYPTFFASWRT